MNWSPWNTMLAITGASSASADIGTVAVIAAVVKARNCRLIKLVIVFPPLKTDWVGDVLVTVVLHDPRLQNG